MCASSTVDLAGHRPPNTPRNFVFRSMPFAEAVARCSGASGGEKGGGEKGGGEKGGGEKGGGEKGGDETGGSSDGSGGAARTVCPSSSVRAVTRPGRTLLPALRRARPTKGHCRLPKALPPTSGRVLAASNGRTPAARPPRPRASSTRRPTTRPCSGWLPTTLSSGRTLT